MKKNLLPEFEKVRSSQDDIIKKDTCWYNGYLVYDRKMKYQKKILTKYGYNIPNDYEYRRVYDNNGFKIDYTKYCDCVLCK